MTKFQAPKFESVMFSKRHFNALPIFQIVSVQIQKLYYEFFLLLEISSNRNKKFLNLQYFSGAEIYKISKFKVPEIPENWKF